VDSEIEIDREGEYDGEEIIWISSETSLPPLLVIDRHRVLKIDGVLLMSVSSSTVKLELGKESCL